MTDKELIERPDLTAMHRSELEATVVAQANLIERFRQGIANIVRELEDEGDRVYLGSTNDADDLRDLDKSLADILNKLELTWMHGRDLYAEMRDLRARLETLSDAAGKLAEALEPFTEIASEGTDDEPDHTQGTLVIGRSTHYMLEIGDFRRAASALQAWEQVRG